MSTLAGGLLSLQPSGTITNTTMETTTGSYPLYTGAVLLPVLALPAWLLCIPPLIWHFSQRNIAAWSLVLWIILMNFFNFINPLIWPRDNVSEWFSGHGLCDIEVRVFVGLSVGLPSCTVMILRKLAKVMDTRNITISTNRSKVVREKVLEILWCWGYPALMILIYYVVQPLRYYIYGISGCVVAYNLSWVSIVLGAMWPPITICVAAYYAGLLVYRLYLYRREFSRLIASRNTTKSRFIRLFVMSLLSVVVYVPYVFWILWLFASQLNEKYTWASVHGPHWNTVIKVPSYGQVRLDKWGQVATGYLAFAVFGTGTDANNTYKRMLCAIGLGRIFPSLYQLSDSGASTPSSFQIGQQWCSACTSKARSFFSKSRTEDRTLQSTIACSRRNSVTEETPVGNTPGSTSFQPVGSRDPILAQQQQQRQPQASPARQPFFRRLLSRRRSQETVLPLFVKKVSPDSTEMEKSPTGTVPSGVYSHVWAPESSSAARHSVSEGVTIITEVHQNDNVRPDQTQKDAAA